MIILNWISCTIIISYQVVNTCIKLCCNINSTFLSVLRGKVLTLSSSITIKFLKCGS